MSEQDNRDTLAQSSPIHRSVSAGSLRLTPVPAIPRSPSAQQLNEKSATQSTKVSAPNSARSDITKSKPLPPITSTQEKSDSLADEDEFASITESELGEEDVISDDEAKSKAKSTTAVKAAASKKAVMSVETQTEWSWTESMKIMNQAGKGSQHDLKAISDSEELPAGAEADTLRTRNASAASKASKAATQISQSSKKLPGEQQSVLPPEGSIAGTEYAPEVMTTLVLPYRDDEYGVPALQFSDSDSESDSDDLAQLKPNKTLPSVGPPQILQYKRDTKHGNLSDSNQVISDSTKRGLRVGGGEATGDSDDLEQQPDMEALNEIITFKGVCEFCSEQIKPFPTLHQQQIQPPEELYCCEEFATFVRLAILPPAPNSHLIDIKPHAHYGSKKARAAAREKAQERMREREIQKVQAIVNKGERNTAGHTGGPSNSGGQGHQSQNAAAGGGGQQLPAAGGGANMFAYKADELYLEVEFAFKEAVQRAMKKLAAPNKLLKSESKPSEETPIISLPPIAAPEPPKITKPHPPPTPFLKQPELQLPPIVTGRLAEETASLLSTAPSDRTCGLDHQSLAPNSARNSFDMSRKSSMLVTKRGSRNPVLPQSARPSKMWLDPYESWINSVNNSTFARAMKTINFQLSSQKCIDEGYVIRPPSPLDDEEFLANPFEIEPVEWYRHGDGSDLEDSDLEDDETAFDSEGRRMPKYKECVERYYPNGEKFLTMFPDGTGNVFYSNGQLAISVSSVEPGMFTYIVYDTQSEEGEPQKLLAEFAPDAVATCYHKEGGVRLFLDQIGGLELQPDGAKRKRWKWLDEETHTHAPPVQPLCFALNKYIGIKVLSQENIAMTFLNYQRSCRFNVGVKLKLVHPENLPISLKYEEDEIFMKQKSNHISGLLQKIDNLLKYPHSHRANKMPVAKRVTIMEEKLQRHKDMNVLAKERERYRRTKKNTRTLPPIDPFQDDIDPVLMTETGEMSVPATQRGSKPKYAVVVN